MRLFIPLALAFLLLSGGGGLFFLHQYLNSDASKITIDGDNTGKSAFGAALRMMVEDTTGATTTTPDVDISALLPEARPGWFRQDYVNAHGEALTGRAIIHSAVQKSDSNSMLLRFETDSKNRRGHHAYTYMRGDLRVMIRARTLEQLNRDTVRGGMMGEVADNMAAATSFMDEGAPDRRFAKMDGVAFTQEAPYNYIRLERRGVPTDYRVFNAKVHGLVHIQIMTNASDNAVAEMIKLLDINAILQQIGKPATTPGFSTHLAEPLSQERPAQTPGQAAFALLQTEHGMTENEIRNMRRISSGEIETREQLQEKVGSGSGLSQVFQDFLANNTFPPEANFEPEIDRQAIAADLIKYIPKASPSEFVLLHLIRTKQVVTFEEAQRYFPHVSSMSRATKGILLGYDPAAPVQQARVGREIIDANGRGESVTIDLNNERPIVAVGNSTKPVVRRFTSSDGLSNAGICTLVDGVRRCTLADG